MLIACYKRFHKITQFLVFLLIAGLVAGCSTGAQMLNRIPIHSVDFKVVNQDGDPIQGAMVEASNGESTTTNSAGMASLRFGSVGIHSITVTATDHMPNTMTVSLPADNNETFTARLAPQVQPASFAGTGFMQLSAGQLYPMLFTYLFNSFGYNMEIADYSEGAWTKWRFVTPGSDSDDAMVLKKAFLRELDNGQQWWQIQLFQDDGNTSSYTAEVLFDQQRSSIRRYREKIEDNEPQEKPVTENWYSQPTRLTQESLEGAVEQENVTVEVPRGTFTADLINFGVGPGVNLKIWRVNEVPGGVVQYSTEQENEMVYESRLVDYGSDARTVLNSY